MAGDWIKMRADLHTHPKVVRLSSALNADRLRIVGGLHAVWCLFDAHSEDGSLSGYTLQAVDELIGFPGFAGAMCGVKWLETGPDGLLLPEFDEHNGQSAKRRATETKRKRQEREAEAAAEAALLDLNLSAQDADKKRSREEKRREESSLRSDQSIPSKYPEEFLLAWAAFPKRPGASKADSLKAWNARIAAGANADAILAGVQRYAAFCIASRTEPKFIKQPATFFGPGEHYLSDWTPSAAPIGSGTIHDRRAATHNGLTQRANHANSDSRTIDAEAHVVG